VTAVVSIHIADVGMKRALRLSAARRPLGGAAGLRGQHVLIAAAVSAHTYPSPMPGRVSLLAFWEAPARWRVSCATIPSPMCSPKVGALLLLPLRMFGSWPGLPDDLPRGRTTSYEGPAVVLTLGRVRLRRLMKFARTSAKAEAAALAAPGFVWGTGLARPPVVVTCSLWESTTALSSYAFKPENPHDTAVVADRAVPFHKRSAFVAGETA
jgi:hypothetical protein